MSRAQVVVNVIRDWEIRLQHPFVIVETGTIRDARSQYDVGDGHSTKYIAQHISKSFYKHMFYSIDLKVSVAMQYLGQLGLLQYVNFLVGSSLEMLPTVPIPTVVYLDSANDAQLILEEFKIVESKMKRGTVIVDDVNLRSRELLKGHRVVPYAREKGYKVNLTERQAIIEL